MTFRTPEEAVALANNTPYGLAASVWTENINLALDIAPKIKAGVVWINSTNLFDAAAGFGGYRESGFGREGGREGMWEYLKPVCGHECARSLRRTAKRAADSLAAAETPATNDSRLGRRSIALRSSSSAASRRAPIRDTRVAILAPSGALVGEVGEGNRKDIRNAVEAAHAAADGWARATGHNRGADPVLHRRESVGARRGVRARASTR